MKSQPASRWPVWGIAILLVAAAWVLTFARCVDRDLNHDEHQFLAPAGLLSREGLVAWKDYPLFHLPNLVYAYAAAEKVTGDLILGPKLLCFGASALLIAGLAIAACRHGRWRDLALAAGTIGLLITSQLFLYTAGKTWNHEIPTALLVASGVCLIAGAARDRLWLVAVAGVLGGLSAGCRLTFAPALVGLALFVWLQPFSTRRRFVHLVVLTLAATVALFPTWISLASHPESFLFGNFEFPRLRLSDPTNTRIQKTVSWWRKVRFFLKEIVIPNWPLFVLWGAVAVRPAWLWIRHRASEHRSAGLWLILFPFVLLGCFAPSRYQEQHFFVFLPLIAAGIVAASVSMQLTRVQRIAIYSSLPVLVFFGIRAGKEYGEGMENFAKPEEWYSSRARRAGDEIRGHVPTGRILTLAPTFPMQGGLSIYPEFVTGTFAWRSAWLVPEERRARLHMVSPADLDGFLASRKPAGILVGVEEEEEEEPLIEWAEKNGYTRIPLRRKRGLWVPPAP